MLKNSQGRLLITTIYILLSFGCASVISPSKGPNLLNTEPSGAEVFDGNSIKLGETPLDLSTIPGATRQLRIKKEGFRDAELSIRRKPNSTLMFVDAMLLCIPCPVDLSGKSLYSFAPNNPTLRLRKEFPSKDNAFRIAVDEVSVNTKGEPKLIINSKEKKLSDKGMSRVFGEVSDGDDVIKEAFKESYIDMVYAGQMRNMKAGIAKPRIYVSPVVTDYSFDLKGKLLVEYKGTQSMTTNWKIYNASDKNKMIGSVTTTTSVYRNEGSNTRLFDALLYESALDFLEVDSLYDFLAKAEKDYISDSKGNEIKITATAAPKYLSEKDALKNAKLAVVTVIGKDGFGSGFIISSDGYLITNYHVIEDETSVYVKLGGDLKMKASIKKTNKEYDLALLKIEADDLKIISIGNSDAAESGDEVYAIGTPMETSLGQSITKGIISGKRNIGGIEFIQTDVSINSGNSGGPLINDKGEMVGVTTMKLAGNGIEGIGFCIPSNKVIEMLNIKF